MRIQSEQRLRNDLVHRTTITRGVMYKATHRIVKWNWYQAGHRVGAMPSRNQMADYGTIAALAYFDEGMEFSKALHRGMQMMSSYASDEGKGVVTTAKAIVEPGHKYTAGSVPMGVLGEGGHWDG